MNSKKACYLVLSVGICQRRVYRPPSIVVSLWFIVRTDVLHLLMGK